MNSYSIKNKGILSEGVEYILIDRASMIKPNLSHLSNLRPVSNEKPPQQMHYLEARSTYRAVEKTVSNESPPKTNVAAFNNKVKFSDEDDRQDRY